MFERSEEAVSGDKRSESPSGESANAGSNPLVALADKGLEPGRVSGRAEKTRDAEVVPKATRRTYTNEYKLKIVRKAEALAGTGMISAMLREEGLYDQQLSDWRRTVASGKPPVKRGPVAKPVDPNAAEMKALRRENMMLKRQLARSELVIDIQKKVASLLGITLAKLDDEDD